MGFLFTCPIGQRVYYVCCTLCIGRPSCAPILPPTLHQVVTQLHVWTGALYHSQSFIVSRYYQRFTVKRDWASYAIINYYTQFTLWKRVRLWNICNDHLSVCRPITDPVSHWTMLQLNDTCDHSLFMHSTQNIIGGNVYSHCFDRSDQVHPLRLIGYAYSHPFSCIDHTSI